MTNEELFKDLLTGSPVAYETTLEIKDKEISELKVLLQRSFGFLKESHENYNICVSSCPARSGENCQCGSQKWYFDRQDFIDELTNYQIGELK